MHLILIDTEKNELKENLLGGGPSLNEFLPLGEKVMNTGCFDTLTHGNNKEVA